MDLPDILFLVHRVPYPPDKGDRIRTFHLLKHLASRARVHVACLADEPLAPENLAVLRRYCTGLAIVPLGRRRWLRALGSFARGRTITERAFAEPALSALIARWAEAIPFQAVLASASSMAPYLELPQLRSIRTVVDLVDVDSQKWFDYAAASNGPKSLLYRTEGTRLRRLECALAQRSDAITFVSEAEADLFRDFCDSENIHAVPNGVDLNFFRPLPGAEDDACVFVGALDYRPNIDAACWFAREVWPRIIRERPESKLYLVGRRPVPAVSALAALRGIEVVGQVPDVRPYVARAAVSVNPLRIARGVQNKVLEALAMAKATVGSPEALTGLAVKPGVEVLAATTADDWASTLLHLFDDADLRRRLGAAGRRYVEVHHGWERCLEPFGELLGVGVAAHLGVVLARREPAPCKHDG